MVHVGVSCDSLKRNRLPRQPRLNVDPKRSPRPARPKRRWPLPTPPVGLCSSARLWRGPHDPADGGSGPIPRLTAKDENPAARAGDGSDSSRSFWACGRAYSCIRVFAPASWTARFGGSGDLNRKGAKGAKERRKSKKTFAPVASWRFQDSNRKSKEKLGVYFRGSEPACVLDCASSKLGLTEMTACAMITAKDGHGSDNHVGINREITP